MTTATESVRPQPAPAGPSRGARIGYWFVSSAVRGVLKLYNRARVTGREHLPAKGPFVLAPTHRSNVDTFAASMLVRRRMRFMGKNTLWKVPAFGRFISSLGAFPVVRGSADRDSMRQCIEILRTGEPLVLFPEGERKQGPVVSPLFDGAAFVAAKAGVQIVPVGIAGTERVMPVGSKMIWPHRIDVVIGPPITVGDGTPGSVPRSAIREATAILHAQLQSLFDEAQRRNGV